MLLCPLQSPLTSQQRAETNSIFYCLSCPITYNLTSTQNLTKLWRKTGKIANSPNKKGIIIQNTPHIFASTLCILAELILYSGIWRCWAGLSWCPDQQAWLIGPLLNFICFLNIGEMRLKVSVMSTELSRPVSRVISLANWANYESLTLRLTSRISLILEYYWNLSWHILLRRWEIFYHSIGSRASHEVLLSTVEGGDKRHQHLHKDQPGDLVGYITTEGW